MTIHGDLRSRLLPRGRGRSFGSFQIQSITVWLILINVAVFVLDSFLKRADPQSPTTM